MLIWRASASRGARLLLFCAAVVAAASCTDQTGLLEPTVVSKPNPLPQNPAQNVLLVPGPRGPVPGRHTMTMGFTDVTTAKDSVWWPDTFAVATRIKMTVNGRITRSYNPDIWPSLNLAGKPYFAIDADGEFISSSCYGMIATDFRTAPNVGGMNIHGCRTGTYYNPNFPPQDGATEHSTIGVAKGFGYVRRIGFGQPSYPATQYCGVWPYARCVWANAGSQDITIEPTANFLSLSATPDSIDPGDLVLFQPAATSGLPYSVKAWIWVPDEPPTTIIAMMAAKSSLFRAPTTELPSVSGFPTTNELFRRSDKHRAPLGQDVQMTGPFTAAFVLDSRTVYCLAPASNCQIPVFQSGTMYVRAIIGSGSSAVLEQASAHVEVAPPTLIAKCDATPGFSTVRIEEVSCSAELSDKTLPFTITQNRAVTPDTVILEPNLSIPYPADYEHYWVGARAVPSTVSFEATVVVAGTTVPLTSNTATFIVTPRTWIEPTVPVLAPVEWVTEQQSLLAFATNDSLFPGPFPGFGLSRKAGVPDTVLDGGVAKYIFGDLGYNIQQIPSGPNKGYVYITTMPTVSTGKVRMLNSLQTGNPFYARQSSASKLPGEQNPPPPYAQYCDPAAMNAFRDAVAYHEGSATGPTLSHHEASRNYVLANKLTDFFEPLVYYRSVGPLQNDSTVGDRFNNQYEKPRNAASTDVKFGGPVPPVQPLTCKLRA